MNLELDVSNLRTTNAALAAALHVAESTARTATKEATYLAHRVSKLEARAANEKASKYEGDSVEDALDDCLKRIKGISIMKT